MSSVNPTSAKFARWLDRYVMADLDGRQERGYVTDLGTTTVVDLDGRPYHYEDGEVAAHLDVVILSSGDHVKFEATPEPNPDGDVPGLTIDENYGT